MIHLFGLPLSSGVLFILAGVLIGHLLWYHDRSAARRTVDSLEDRYSKAKGAARKRRYEVADLQKENDARRDDFQQLQTAFDGVESERNQLVEQTRTMQSELLTLRKQSQDHSDRFEDERRRAETLVGELQEALKQKAATDQAAEDLRRDFTARGNDLKRRDDRIAELETQINDADARVGSAADEVTEVKALVGRIDTAHGETRRELEAVVAERDEARRELERVRAEITDATTSIETLRDEAAAARVQAAETKIHLNETRQAVADADGRADAVRAELETAKAETAAARTEIERLTAELHTAGDEARDGAETMGQQRETVQRLERELADARQAETDAAARLTASAEEYDTLRGTIDDLRRTIDDLENNVRLRDTEVARLGELSTMRADEAAGAAGQIERLKIELAEATAGNESMAADLSTALAELQTSREQADELRSQTEAIALTWQSRVADETARAATLAGVIEQREQRIAELQAKADVLPSIRDELESIRDEYNQTLAAVETLRGEIERMESEAETARVTIGDRDAEIEGAVAERKRLTEQLDDVTARWETAAAELATLEPIRDEVAQVQQQVGELNEQLADARFEADARNAEVIDRETQLTIARQAAVELQTRVERAETERDGLAAQIERLSAAESQLRDDQTAAAESLAEEKSRFESIVEGLRNQLATRVGELQTARAETESQAAATDDFRGRFEAAHEELSTLRPKLAEVDDYRSRLERLRAEYDDSIAQNEQLSGRIESLQRQAADDADKIRQLRRDRADVADLKVRRAA